MINHPGGLDPARLAEWIGVSRVANITGLDRIGVPVASAIRPITRNLSTSFGKGLEWEGAWISAIMESAEYYFGERPPAGIRMACYNELHRENAIDVTALEIENPVDDIRRQPMGWLEGHDLVDGEPVWVPAELLDMDYTLGAGRRQRHFKPAPAGLAAHFDRSLAVRHGLLEVLERDAHRRWNLRPDYSRAASRIDPRTTDCPKIASVLDRIAAADLAVFTWEMTSVPGIACYLAEIVDFANGATTAYAQGSAADHDPPAALLKALLEAAQVRLTYIAGSRDDLDWSEYGARFDAIVASRWRLRDAPPGKAVAPPAQAEQSLARLCERIGDQRVAVVDVTRPGDPAHVVKVVVPHLADVREIERGAAGYSAILEFAEG